MKYLLALLLSSCAIIDTQIELQPGDRVLYNIPKAYSKVCSGKGTIVKRSPKMKWYLVATPEKEKECPDKFFMYESELKYIGRIKEFIFGADRAHPER
jgi:hypothetical protein